MANARAEAVAALEADISATEAALAGLGEALQTAAAGQDFAALQRLTADYAATEQKLEQLFKDWEGLTHEPANDHRLDR